MTTLVRPYAIRSFGVQQCSDWYSRKKGKGLRVGLATGDEEIRQIHSQEGLRAEPIDEV